MRKSVEDFSYDEGHEGGDGSRGYGSPDSWQHEEKQVMSRQEGKEQS